jgi:hypothetical protein
VSCAVGTDCTDCGPAIFCPGHDCMDRSLWTVPRRTLYRPGQKCPTSNLGLILGSVFGGLAGLGLLTWFACWTTPTIKGSRKRTQNRRWVKTPTRISIPSAGTMAKDGLDDLETGFTKLISASHTEFPSGQWHGYYHQYGQRHSLLTFHLTFDATRFSHSTRSTGVIRGSGEDGVGCYSINGVHNYSNGRIAFTKTYKRGTGNSFENKGHSVEYSGEAQLQGSLAAGVRGKWNVYTRLYSGSGDFHIWPEKPLAQLCRLPQLSETTISPVARSAEASGGRVFVASNQGECVVCYHKQISTCLLPCGHIAMCAACARKVSACPICRSQISKIDTITGI